MLKTHFCTFFLFTSLSLLSSEPSCQDPNCQTCNYNYHICDTCNQGFYEDWGICYRNCFDENCVKCNDGPEFCAKSDCKRGYVGIEGVCLESVKLDMKLNVNGKIFSGSFEGVNYRSFENDENE